MVRMPSQRRLRVATRRYEATAAAAAVEGLAGWKVKKPPSIRPALPKKTCVSIAPTLGGLRVLAKVYVALEQHTNEYCVHCGLCTCQWHLGNYAMTPYSRQPPHARAHLPYTVPTWYPRGFGRVCVTPHRLLHSVYRGSWRSCRAASAHLCTPNNPTHPAPPSFRKQEHASRHTAAFAA